MSASSEFRPHLHVARHLGAGYRAGRGRSCLRERDSKVLEQKSSEGGCGAASDDGAAPFLQEYGVREYRYTVIQRSTGVVLTPAGIVEVVE